MPKPTAGNPANQITRNTSVFDVHRILNLHPVLVDEKQLLLEVAEAMIQQPTVTVAAVVNTLKVLVGILPLQNLVDELFMSIVPEEFLSEAYNLENALHFADLNRSQTAAEAMLPMAFVHETELVKDAFRKMHDHNLTGIPVVDHQMHVTGFLSLLELLSLYTHSQKSMKESE